MSALTLDYDVLVCQVIPLPRYEDCKNTGEQKELEELFFVQSVEGHSIKRAKKLR